MTQSFQLPSLQKLACALLAFCLPAAAGLEAQEQRKLRRAESFLGFHFDFHAVEKDKELGKNFDLDLLDTFLSRTKPDYIQIDSKGHFGYSSYPTKAGYSADSFVKDPVRLWKDMADRHNLPLYVHYSGYVDDEAIRRNPQWAKLDAKGKKDKSRVSYACDYTEKLFIPQLKELIETYQIDGAWIDGDCWTARLDYSPAIVEGFKKETGLDAPTDADSPDYELWREYNRRQFKGFLRNYLDLIHQYKPGFQITSNWAYSSRMPEPVDTGVDFLSGDVAGTNCVYSAAFEARCLALQGMPWDLMSWGMMPINFWGGIHTIKPVIQLKQEAAQTIAMGGGYQVYFRQNRDGAFQTLDTEALAGLAAFCRERQPFSHNNVIIPQIGIWYSVDGWKNEIRKDINLYGGTRTNQKLKSVFNLFLDTGHPVEILMDHHMAARLRQYELVVVPEWKAFNPAIKAQLMEHVRNGANVIVIGAETAAFFKEWLGVAFTGKVEEKPAEIMIGGRDLGGVAGLKTKWQPVTANPGTERVGGIFSQTDYRYMTENAIATIAGYGKGRIACVYADMSDAHAKYRNPVFNALIKTLIEKMLPDPLLRVAGSSEVHTVVASKNGATQVHLINAGGHHSNPNVFGYDELRPVPPLALSIKSAARPAQVKLQPGGVSLKFEYKAGRVEVETPPIGIHAIVELTP